LSEENSIFWNSFESILSTIPPIEVAEIGAEVMIVSVHMVFVEVLDALACGATVYEKRI